MNFLLFVNRVPHAKSMIHIPVLDELHHLLFRVELNCYLVILIKIPRVIVIVYA